MKTIDELDKNFKIEHTNENGLVFRNCLEEPFTLHGLFTPHETGVFSRLPLSFSNSEEVSKGVRRLMFHTSGGRVRFKTNSKVIAVRATLSNPTIMYHMPATGSQGFDLYATSNEGEQKQTFKKIIASTESEYNISHTFDDCYMREITINFPLYNGVESLYIGIEEKSTIEKASPYKIEKPIVFYGSSVTQGACASRPGTSYPSLLSRWLDADFINLGFSGNDRGEPAIAHHIASLEMSAFVYGYGYNARTIEHYKNTYYPFYEIIRKKNPELPIIMMSSPLCPELKTKDRLDYFTEAREIVINSYEKAKSNGENVYFIDGFTLLENPESTVDGTHPTDLGFYEMATKIYPTLKEICR